MARQRIPQKQHGQSRTRTYVAWQNARNRCYLPSCPEFRRYNMRGITMSDAWRNDFTAFWRDMGECPPGLTLDRIDNDGPYTGPCTEYPEGNCRWTTPRIQSNNRSDNRRITFRGETRTLAEWAREVGIEKNGLAGRLDRGWSVETALTTKPDAGPFRPDHRNRFITIGEDTRTIAEWSRASGLHRAVIEKRLKKGWTPERAVHEPARPSRMITVGSVTCSLSEWSRRTGIHITTIYSRLKLGWTPERAVRR